MKKQQPIIGEHPGASGDSPRALRMQACAFRKTALVVSASDYDAMETRLNADNQICREKHRTTWTQLDQLKMSAERTERHAALLAQALGECLIAAGITQPDASLSGPDLLMFADDLKRQLSRQTIVRGMPGRAEFEGIHGGHQMRTQDEADANNAALDEVARAHTIAR